MINAILQLRSTVSLSFERAWQFCGKIFFDCITNHFRKLSISTKAFDYRAIGLFTFFFLWGQYCIYKKGNCPEGLSEGYIFFDDENHKNINEKGGTLPDGVYNKDTNISYCCRTDGDKLKPISLPVMSPFYLMAYNTSECQRVKGALAKEEFIRHNNQDTDNKDSMNGTHPFEEGKKNITIMYCYYKGKYSQRSKTGKLEWNAYSITNRNHIYPNQITTNTKSGAINQTQHTTTLSSEKRDWLKERETCNLR